MPQDDPDQMPVARAHRAADCSYREVSQQVWWDHYRGHICGELKCDRLGQHWIDPPMEHAWPMVVACHPEIVVQNDFGLTLTDPVFAEEMEEIPREHSFIRCEWWIQHRKCLKVFETENLLNLQENFTRS